MGADKYLITQSLLSSFNYAFITENGANEFRDALERKPKPQTEAMLNGIHFENLVNTYAVNGRVPEDCEWGAGVRQIGDIVQGAAQQVKLSRDVNIGGVDIVLYGVLDFLKSGIIYDCKFSKTYRNGKYRTSPQHPMYFAICPEAYRFVYLISDGEYMWREAYDRDDIPKHQLSHDIVLFMNYLDKHGLTDTYRQNWKAEY